MRRLLMTACALALGPILASPAHAQNRGGGMGGRMMTMGPALMANKSVQADMKLSDEQIGKIDKAAVAFREKMQEAIQDMQDATPEERQAKGAELVKMADAEAKKLAAEVLTPEQATRYQQIVLQNRGLQAFMDPAIAEKLKITADQKSKIGEIQRESREEMMGLREKYQDDPAGAMKKSVEITYGAVAKGVAVLSDEQKAIWKEMTGAPFTIKIEPMGRRPA